MRTVWQRAEGWLVAGGALVALAAGHAVSRCPSDARPQIPADSVLTLALGDARQQLSQLMFDKVEEYFHGGVRDVACEHGLASKAPERHGEGAGREAVPCLAAADPWAWLNAQVHVQEHTHLENDTAVELLPWVWASCRMSPKNVQAFTAGSYVLARMLGRPEDGARLLEEGVRKNPDSAELEFSLGELLLNRVRDPVRAEPHFLAALQKSGLEKDAGEREEADALKMETLFYLGYLAKTRGDVSRLRGYVRQADALNPAHISARNLHALLSALEKKE